MAYLPDLACLAEGPTIFVGNSVAEFCERRLL